MIYHDGWLILWVEKEEREKPKENPREKQEKLAENKLLYYF